MAEPRRFPPPWTVEEIAQCFIVRDANRQALAVHCLPQQNAAAHQAAPCR
jgi:hypothetical protein